jgi:hypothetical protein
MRLLMYVFIMRAITRLVVIFFTVSCSAHIAAHRAYLFARFTVLSTCYRTHLIVLLSMLYLKARIRVWRWRFLLLKWKLSQLFQKEGSHQ